VTDLGALGLFAAALVGAVALGEGLRLAGWRPESTRRVVHVLVGLAVAGCPPWFSGPGPIYVLAIVFLVGNVVAVRQRWMPGMHAIERRSWGTVTFPLALLVALGLCWTLDPSRVYVLQTAFVVLALADPAASLLGEWVGRPVRIGGAMKSAAGSAAFLLVATVSAAWALDLTTTLGAVDRLGWALTAAALATLAEALGKTGWDNLWIVLAAMVPRAADLAASYMVAGFVHGVLNSDNIAITGESFDYGPWRFAPTWAPAFTAAYFDHGGLYSFGRQPETLHWNCAQLAIALRTIADAQPLIAILEGFADAYRDAFVKRFLWRLGVAARDPASDLALVEAAERMMVATSLPIDRFFFAYAAGRGASGDEPGRAFEELLARHRPARALDDRYWSGDAPQAMLIDEVEAIWAAIAERDDWTPLTDKIAAVRAFGAVMSA